MTCGTCLEKLGLYIDGACSPEDTAALDEHLRNCPQCASEALSRLRMKQMTRSAAARYTPSPQFRMQVEKSTARRRSPLLGFRWMPALAALAFAAFLIVASIAWMRHSERRQAVAELVDLHIATLASANPVDVVSADRHTVKPWFQGKLPFTFSLPELGNSPFKLLGGKLIYFRHSPGAQLLFALGKHQLSVFILQDQPGPEQPTLVNGSMSEKGFSVDSWSRDGSRFVVVGDANPADVRALSDLLRAAGK